MLSLTRVAPESPDYVRVIAELKKLDCTLLKLETINNPLQEQNYESMKLLIKEEVAREGGELNEHTFLFHGTSNIFGAEGITRSGFDNRYFKLDGKFGAGTYLADDMAKSHAYTQVIPDAGGRVIFVCKAMLGKLEELKEKKVCHCIFLLVSPFTKKRIVFLGRDQRWIYTCRFLLFL